MAILLQTEATERARLITVDRYGVRLDLTQGDTEFASQSHIEFRCSEPGASTFVDLKAASIESIMFNDKPIGTAEVKDGRLELTDLRAENLLSVTARMAYTRDGQGLHRAVDPADGQAYVYGMSFLDAAPQIYACFDQPDLKAPYDLQVTAPEGWVVAGNSPARESAPGEWRFEQSKPLATYFFTVCAGPYATVRDEHRGIPLAIHARASLRADLERHAAQILQVTRQGFDYFEELFDIAYPWGEYHQFFVPEFNAGAMENPGCVTIRDQYLYRGAATHAEVLQRSNTVLHEMAHMWFGDLVSMKWWDDLWLNESFAEYMAHRSATEATEFTDAWVDFGVARKNWGYAADRAPSTHPIAGNAAPDSDSALANFDGISYAKGCSALRQLAAFVGDDAFIGGVRDYLPQHAYGNATLADFLAAIAAHTDADLTTWSTGWLETAGTDEISVEVEGAPISTVRAVRTTPEAHPADRTHVLDIAGFAAGRELWRTELFTLGGDDGEDAQLVGRERPKLLLPNASDLTWVVPVFDAATLDAVPDELSQIQDAGARQVVWSGLLNGMALAAVDPRLVLRTFQKAWAVESNQSLRHWIPQLVLRALHYLPYEERAAARAEIGETALLATIASASADVVDAARIAAQTIDDEPLLRAWAGGSGSPGGLGDDVEFQWLALQRLAALGLADNAEIDRFAAVDSTMTGRQNALAAKAIQPTPEAKQWAWDQLGGNDDLSNYEALAIAGTIFTASDPALVRPYVERYFEVIPALADRLGEFATSKIARAGFPIEVTEPATSTAAHAALDRGRMTANVRRAVVDSAAALDEALASMRIFKGGRVIDGR
ncbi:aminopeptidase N [Yimella sp. cx-573]|nr:aminopeptidase N [Yimella sp. cx-573]